MKAIWNDQIIADSDATIEIENNAYFPIDAVHEEFLEESDYTTECIWKGTAHYYHIIVNGERNENAAWYYPSPKDGSIERVGKDFTDYVAFLKGVVVSE